MAGQTSKDRSLINRKNASRPRISGRLREGIRALVWEGLSTGDAAERAEMKRNSFLKALRKPHVRALVEQEFKELRSGEHFRAYARMVNLAEDACSEDVKLRANQWIAGVEGLAPASNVRGSLKVSHGFHGYSYRRVLDGKAETSD